MNLATGRLPLLMHGQHGPTAQGHTLLISWVIVGWAALSLAFAGISLGGQGLYVEQPLHFGLIGLLAMLQLGNARTLALPRALLIIILLVVLPAIVQGVSNERFLPEELKMVSLFAGAFAISGFISWRQVKLLGEVLPPLLCAMLLVTAVTGTWDYYGDSRFGVPLLGSPNSAAFAIETVIVFRLFLASIRPQGRWVDALIIATLFGFLLWTDSDTGKVTVAVVVLRYLGVPMRILLPGLVAGVALAILSVFLFDIELPELLGSGRLYIWGVLVDTQLNGGVWNLLFGFGPGGIDLEPGFTLSVRSAHSMYLEIAYAYGLVGLSLTIYAVVRLGLAISGAALAPKARVFLEALFISTVVGCFTDAHFVTAQLVWLGSLVLGMLAGLSTPPSANLAKGVVSRRPELQATS